MHVLQKREEEGATHECLGMMNKPAYLVNLKTLNSEHFAVPPAVLLSEIIGTKDHMMKTLQAGEEDVMRPKIWEDLELFFSSVKFHLVLLIFLGKKKWEKVGFIFC